MNIASLHGCGQSLHSPHSCSPAPIRRLATATVASRSSTCPSCDVGVRRARLLHWTDCAGPAGFARGGRRGGRKESGEDGVAVCCSVADGFACGRRHRGDGQRRLGRRDHPHAHGGHGGGRRHALPRAHAGGRALQRLLRGAGEPRLGVRPLRPLVPQPARGGAGAHAGGLHRGQARHELEQHALRWHHVRPRPRPDARARASCSCSCACLA